MPAPVLRRCDRCKNYHVSYVIDDPQGGGKLHLCYSCWKEEVQGTKFSAGSETVQSLLANPPKKIDRLDLLVLLAHLLGQPRAWVMTHPEAVLTQEQLHAWQAGLGKLRRGVPLPYVLGCWEFFGLEMIVSPDVLIPRPETELLVETALGLISKPDMAIRNCIDVGTGSGCIAVALATHTSELIITATDISSAALAIAHANAEKHGVLERIRFLEADLLESPTLAAQLFDLLVANLPYIPTWTLRQLDVYDHEPSLALDGGPDGLTLIKRLLESAPAHLSPGGALLLEIEASQGQPAQALARQAFPEAKIQMLPDLAGKDRLLAIWTG
jgi:release factor glutamine methyltransferase